MTTGETPGINTLALRFRAAPVRHSPWSRLRQSVTAVWCVDPVFQWWLPLRALGWTGEPSPTLGVPAGYKHVSTAVIRQTVTTDHRFESSHRRTDADRGSSKKQSGSWSYSLAHALHTSVSCFIRYRKPQSKFATCISLVILPEKQVESSISLPLHSPPPF